MGVKAIMFVLVLLCEGKLNVIMSCSAEINASHGGLFTYRCKNHTVNIPSNMYFWTFLSKQTVLKEKLQVFFMYALKLQF